MKFITHRRGAGATFCGLVAKIFRADALLVLVSTKVSGPPSSTFVFLLLVLLVMLVIVHI